MAKWSDFETHPVGTSDRIKELEQLVASLEAEIEQWKFDSAAGWDKCEEYRFKLVELEAENKFLNQQMDSIEEMGTDDLNALPDCLMRLAPALGENRELKAKLETVMEAIYLWANADCDMDFAMKKLLAVRAEVKGQDDD